MRNSILFAFVVALALGWNACGGASVAASGSSGATGAVSSSPLLISAGDAPLSNVLSAAVTISAVNFTNSSGAVVSALSQPVTVQLASLGGVQAPLHNAQLAAGTYTSIAVTVSAATVTYLSGSSAVTATAVIPSASATAAIALNPDFVVSGSTTDGLNLGLDFDLAQSLDLTNGVVTFTPVIGAAMVHVAQQPQPPQMHITGTVTAVSASADTITLQAPDTQMSVVVTVNGNTKYGNNLTLATIAVGSVLQVVAQVQSDGSLLALSVQSANGGAPLGSGQQANQGIVTAITTSSGGALESFTMVAQLPLQPPGGNGQGGPAAAPPPGQTLTVTVGSSTTYLLSTQAQTAGLPSFDSTQIFPGAGVMVTGTGSGASLTATAVTSAPVNPFGLLNAAPVTTSGGYSLSLLLNALDPFATFSKVTTLKVLTNSSTMYQGNGLTSSNVSALTAGAPLTIQGYAALASGAYTLYAASVTEEAH